MQPRPSGTVTFLFTGIEGSTRRWEAEPAAMEAELAVHDELLGSVVAVHGPRAGELFVERARAVLASFAFDGIPLAIELAAAGAVSMTPGEIPDGRFNV